MKGTWTAPLLCNMITQCPGHVVKSLEYYSPCACSPSGHTHIRGQECRQLPASFDTCDITSYLHSCNVSSGCCRWSGGRFVVRYLHTPYIVLPVRQNPRLTQSRLKIKNFKNENALGGHPPQVRSNLLSCTDTLIFTIQLCTERKYSPLFIQAVMQIYQTFLHRGCHIQRINHCQSGQP